MLLLLKHHQTAVPRGPGARFNSQITLTPGRAALIGERGFSDRGLAEFGSNGLAPFSNVVSFQICKILAPDPVAFPKSLLDIGYPNFFRTQFMQRMLQHNEVGPFVGTYASRLSLHSQ